MLIVKTEHENIRFLAKSVNGRIETLNVVNENSAKLLLAARGLPGTDGIDGQDGADGGVGDYQFKNSAYTVLVTDSWVECDGTFDVTLPVTGNSAPWFLQLTNSGTGTITPLGEGGATISAPGNRTTIGPGENWTIGFNGTNFRVL